MNTLIFYNETSSNGKYQVMTQLNLIEGEYYHKTTVQPFGIHSHKNQIYKNLHNYWVTKNQLNLIKEKYTTERTSF